jgi:phage-related protein
MEEPYPLDIQVLDSVEKHLGSLKLSDEAKIRAAMGVMRRGTFSAVHTKPVKGKIRELIVRQFRLLYFLKDKTLYFVSMFVKKTAKTPKHEIEYAEKIFKVIKNQK